jgi:acyl-CoA thioester hydrolase
MTQRFRRRFRVRHYELDFFGHVNNAVYAQYLQEAALGAADAAGFGHEWHQSRGVGWVIRRLTIRYHAPAVYGDEVEVVTWLSSLRGVRAHREYIVTRAGDGAVLAKARALWVHVDVQTGQPARCDEAMLRGFAPSGAEEGDLGVRLTKAQPTADACRYRSQRRVQFHEQDAAQHVNHAVYLHWVGQAYFDALRAAGHPLEHTRPAGWLVLQGGHDIEYFAPARDGDPIAITSWVCEMGKVRGAWTHEICHGVSGKLLARDYSLGVFVDATGKPTPLPPRVIEDVLSGPA